LILTIKKLSKNSKIYFTDPKNEFYFSMASFWEICIKGSIGKLSLSTNWEQTIKEELSPVGWATLFCPPNHKYTKNYSI
jgi:PIN domain nuclease of toxin-antitoxin system